MEMQAQGIWLTLKENIKCTRSKLTNVGSKLIRSYAHTCRTDDDHEPPQAEGYLREVLFRGNHKQHPRTNIEAAGNAVPIVLFRPIHPRTTNEVLLRPHHPRPERFYEINIGDPSRKIIETIFKKGLSDASKHSRKIKRVFKVKNSAEIVERFEKYREKVKKKAYEQLYAHPRSSVDGNEMLRFYGTVMTCGERSTQVCQLCKDPFCRVCRILHSNFDIQKIKKNGIRLSTSSEEFCDNSMIALTKIKNVKRAAIVCRTIAGEVANTVDGAFEKCDSFRSGGPHSYSAYLTVKDPCAVLPCFAVVFT